MPAAFNMIGEANPAVVVGNQFPQNCFALDKRKLHQVEAIEIEQVERIEVDRDLLVRRCNIARRGTDECAAESD